MLLLFFVVKKFIDNSLRGLKIEQMLDLNKKITSLKNPDEKTRLQRQLTATDEQIDNLVYELYGLTEDEIDIVKGTKK